MTNQKEKNSELSTKVIDILIGLLNSKPSSLILDLSQKEWL